MLEVKNLFKKFDKNEALINVSFSFVSPDIIAIIGPNGSGKSTLLNLLTSQDKVTSGNINAKFSLFEMGYVKDIDKLSINLTGMEYLNSVGSFFPTYSIEFRDYLIDIFDMKSKIFNRVPEYSHGMTKKILLIAEIMHMPKILFLDEPFSGLDPEYIIFLEKLIINLHSIGVTILLTSHDLNFVEKFAKKILVLIDGRLEYFGEKDILLSKLDGGIANSWLKLIHKEDKFKVVDNVLFKTYKDTISRN